MAYQGGSGFALSVAKALGLVLDAEALQSVTSLPEEYVSEFLEGVAKKVHQGTIANPNKYICGTMKRGYTPNEAYRAQRASGALAPKAIVLDGPHSDAALEAAVDRVRATGVVLTEEAAAALGSVPQLHAVEILDHVAEKAGELRDPSNYVVATIARGYQPRGERGKGKGYPSPLTATPEADGRFRRTMLPEDVRPLERRVVELNGEGLWGEQKFDVATLLALRCLPQEQALEVLEGFANKARTMKGHGKGISNINNYMQAAVTKILRGEGPRQSVRPEALAPDVGIAPPKRARLE